jgi:thiamine-phosphate pyrophosphorylase
LIRYHITGGLSLDDTLDTIHRSAAAGVDWIQVREKHLPARELARWTTAILEAAAGRAKVLVNTRVDVALACGAAGVHLPAGAPPPSAWRGLVLSGFLVGVSCHTVEEVRESEQNGADFAVFAPVFAPLSKRSALPPHGLARLAEAARAVRIPVLALGGITWESAPLCLEAGAAGIAGITLFRHPSPR